jgi:lactate dehydrogenase-like 2-hydroxyacid dehydrogenase
VKIVIVDALTFGDADLSSFFKLGDVDLYQTTSATELLERVANANVIVTNKVVISRDLMLQLQELKLICVAATGMNNVDLDAAKEMKIEVKNVTGYSSNSVIQHTFSMLFYLMGHSKYYDDFVKNGSYAKSKIFTDITKPFFEVKGKKWGIIGLGTIGHGVADVAKAFGAKICYYSTSGKNSTDEFERVDLDELLRSCDIISIHAPLNEKTLNLLGYEQLLMSKNKAVILNLGRGGIIDEEAVARIIDEREIYFGLDVLSSEPMIENHPLQSIKNRDNLYITPHIAWASVEARAKLIAGVVQNIESFMR